MSSIRSLYIHVPYCRHLCNYCDFYKVRLSDARTQFGDYERYLQRNWERHESLRAQLGLAWEPLETLYFGGGTPSLWVRGPEFLAQKPFSELRLATGAEVTLEIDPGAWDEASLRAWKEFGVNRFSVGTQAFDEDFLRVLDRTHDLASVRVLLGRLAGENFSVDFLLGAPELTQPRQIERELEELLRYEPRHVSLYILQPAAGYKLKTKIPDDERVGAEYLRVSEFLRAAGYHHYEVSNFAQPGFESRHNLRYWHSQSVAGLGPSATGFFALSGTEGLRYKWKVSDAREEREELGLVELNLEKLYLRLRLSVPFAVSEFYTSERSQALFTTLLESWRQRGLCQNEGSLWRMQPSGWVVIDSLMGELFQSVR